VPASKNSYPDTASGLNSLIAKDKMPKHSAVWSLK
jgi:hypothetical protein